MIASILLFLGILLNSDIFRAEDDDDLPPMPKFNYTISELMELNDYTPHIVRENFPVFCNIVYPPENFSIKHTNMYRAPQLIEKPIIKWINCDSEKQYTLIFSNVDNVNDSHSWMCQIHWWLVINIPNCNVEEGQVIFDYMGPRRWPEFGKNETTDIPIVLRIFRQILLIYEQPKEIAVELPDKGEVNETARRTNFTLQEFADYNNFSTPVAGNFFRLGIPLGF